MHRIAVNPSTGSIAVGAASNPHRPVNTTSDITRGFVSATKSRQSAGRLAFRARLVMGSLSGDGRTNRTAACD